MTEPFEKGPEVAPDWGVVSRFRRVVVGLSLVLLVAVAGLALSAGKAAAQGVTLGGLAGLLAFEIAVRSFQGAGRAHEAPDNGVENHPGDKVKFLPSIWWVIRYLAYVAVLVKGYDLDTAHYRGLIGAIAGLFVVRVVVMIVGVTGMDLKKASG